MFKKLLVCLFFSVAVFANAKTTIDPVTVTVNLNGTLSITNNTSSSGTWNLKYGPVGSISGGTATVISNIVTNPKILTTNTFLAYEFSVQNKDFWGNLGPWSATVVFTNCTGAGKPVGYFTDFESGLDCWNGYPNPLSYATYTWVGISNNQGYPEDSGNAFRLDSDSYSSTAVGVLPKLAGLSTDKKLTFKLYGGNGSQVKIGSLSNPNDFTTFHPIETIETPSNVYGWRDVTVYLNNYNGVDEYLAITFKKIYGGSTYVQIDNFSYLSGINCFTPTNLTVNSITEHTAQLSFTAAAEQNLWEVNLENTTNYTNFTFELNTSNYTLQNLVGGSTYKVKVRAKCGSDQFSEWTPINTFVTICEGMSNGYTTSFGNTGTLDPCWKKITTGSANINLIEAYVVNSNNVVTPRTGTRMVQFDSWSSLNDLLYLVSPYVNDIGTGKRLRFNLISKGTLFDYNESSLIIGTVSSPDNLASFQPLKTITPQEMSESRDNTSPVYWKEHTIYLDNYTGNNKYFAIKHGQQFINTSFFIDDLTYEDIPACTEPLYPVLVDREADHAIVTWQNYSGSVSTEWQIEYGHAGFTHGQGTMVVANSYPFTLNGLDADTDYEFYVRAKCGTSFSNWSDTGRFRTKCTGVDVGYAIGFEDEAATYLNSCWTRLTPPDDNWDYKPSTYLSTFVAAYPQTFAAHTGGKSLMFRNPYNHPDPQACEKTILVSPRLNNFNNYKNLKFWIYTESNAYASAQQIIIGTLSDPDDYTTFTPFYTITNAGQFEDQWKQYTIDFSSYTGTDKYIGIRQAAVNENTIIYFDDFEYTGIACTTPTTLQAYQTAQNAVTLTWNANSATPPQSWEVELDGVIQPANSNPHTIGDLILNSTHSFRVRNVCTTGYGEWSLPYTFKVSCTATAPYYENFDTYVNNPVNQNCWTKNSLTYFDAFCTDGLNSCPNGMKLTFSNNWGTGVTGTGYAASPYLPDFDNNKKIKFFLKNVSATNLGNLIVGTMQNPLDASTFVPYTTVILGSDARYGKQFEVDFSDYTGSNKHIAFKHDGVDYSYPIIDDFHYLASGQCEEPLNLMATNVTSNSVLVKWDARDAAQSYTIEYGPSNFTLGTGTILNPADSEVQISGLQPSSAYQIYIRSVCDNGQSILVGPVKFTTACAEVALPYFENFASLPQYGANVLPACYRLLSGDANTQAQNINMPFSDPIYGFNDTFFMYFPGHAYTRVISPAFNMIAGTTYTLKMLARKSYQYTNVGIQCRVGRGNAESLIDTRLNMIGTIEHDNFSEIKYNFTPLESGSYSFMFIGGSLGGYVITMDNLQLTEGYNGSVQPDSQTFNFENGNSTNLIFEGTENTSVAIATANGNSYVQMNGGTTDTAWNESDAPTGRMVTNALPQTTPAAWEANENFITKINMKVNAVSMTSLYMVFDLKQTFKNLASESMFRVIVNGNVVGNIIMPASASGDAYVTHQFDLSAYTGADIRISLQHIGRHSGTDGDNAFVDNIKFSQFPLSAYAPQFDNFRLYPNPAKNVLMLQNEEAISDVEIFSISGQQLHKSAPASAEVKLDVSGYSNGVYLLKVTSEGRQKTFKFVKN